MKFIFNKKWILLFWTAICAICSVITTIIIPVTTEIPTYFKNLISNKVVQISVSGEIHNSRDNLYNWTTQPLLISKKKILFVHIPIPTPKEKNKKTPVCSQLHFMFSSASETIKNTRITFKFINKIDQKPISNNYLNSPELTCSFDTKTQLEKSFSGKEELTRSMDYNNDGTYNINRITYFISDIFNQAHGYLNFMQQATPNFFVLNNEKGNSIYNTTDNEINDEHLNTIYFNIKPIYVSVIQTDEDGSESEIGKLMIFYHTAPTYADLLLNAKITQENYTKRFFSNIKDIYNIDSIESIFINVYERQLNYGDLNEIAKHSNNDISALISKLKNNNINKITSITDIGLSVHCEKIDILDKFKYYLNDKNGDFSDLSFYVNANEFINKRNKIRANLAITNTFSPSIYEKNSIFMRNYKAMKSTYQNDCGLSQDDIKPISSL